MVSLLAAIYILSVFLSLFFLVLQLKSTNKPVDIFNLNCYIFMCFLPMINTLICLAAIVAILLMLTFFPIGWLIHYCIKKCGIVISQEDNRSFAVGPPEGIN